MVRSIEFPCIEVTKRDIEQLKLEYELGVKSNLRTVFFGFEKSNKGFMEIEMELLESIIKAFEAPDFGSLTIQNKITGHPIVYFEYAES